MEIDLDRNSISGMIEDTFVKCRNLTQLVLVNNQIVGSIPDYLSGRPLMVLDLDSNNFTGSLPANILDSSFIQHHGVYDLSFNKLSDWIPVELGNRVVLVDILINNNMLSGTIPPKNGDYSLKLQGLYLGYNQLTGIIPRSLGQLISLVKLKLTGNMLSGSIPFSFGNLDELTHLDLSSNELNGELPLSLSSMVNLVGLYVHHNKLSDPVDQFFSNSMAWRIQIVNLSRNLFNGDLPHSLGNLSYLITLDLHGNMFTGEIPLSLGNLMELEYLDISENRLFGQIPEKMCSLNTLFILNLAHNRLEGPVPRSGVCQNLSKTLLAGNKNLWENSRSEMPDQ